MLTYVGGRIAYGKLTGNTQTNNLAFGDQLINQYIGEYLHEFPNIMAERTDTSLYTIPSVQTYLLPPRVQKMNTVTVDVNDFKWNPTEITSMQQWNKINLVENITSDIPTYYFVYNQTLHLYPTPASGDNQITIRYQTEAVTLYQPNATTTETTYTASACPLLGTLTGSVTTSATSATLTGAWSYDTGTYRVTFSNSQTRPVTFTNASTTISWTDELTSTATTAITIRSQYGGDIIVTTASPYNTYANNTSQIGLCINQESASRYGDSVWYFVDSVMTNGNAFVLKSRYGGQSFTGQTLTVTVGEVSPLPEYYQFLPIYRAVSQYYFVFAKDKNLGATYKAMADELYSQMKADLGDQNIDPTIYDNSDFPIINPNLTINSGLEAAS